MVRTKNTKKALLASVLSIVLCIAMLAGATFAWFTDSVTSASNKIVAGNLEVDLIHVGGGEGNTDVSLKADPNHKIFNYNKWEPGYTAMETLKVVNEGNLALKFQLDAVADSATVGPNGVKLADVIDVYVYEGNDIPSVASFAEIKNNTNWQNKGSLSSLLSDPAGFAHGILLPSGKSETNIPSGSIQMTVALHMQETAGNDYQGLSLGDLNFILKATQYTYEQDGFGSNDYDANAVFADEYVGNSAELTEAIANAEDGSIISLSAGTYDENITINKDITLIGNRDTVIYGKIQSVADGADYSTLSVDGITFAQSSSIDEAYLKALTLKNCEIKSGNLPFIDSTNEANGARSIQYTLIGNTFTGSADANYPIMTYASFADGSVISDNVFGSPELTINSFAFRPMNVDDGATITVSNNVVYSLGYYAFSFYNNADRAADYTIIFENNETHVEIPAAPNKGFLWIQSRVNRNDIHATIIFRGENTYNQNPVTADNINCVNMQMDVITE